MNNVIATFTNALFIELVAAVRAFESQTSDAVDLGKEAFDVHGKDGVIWEQKWVKLMQVVHN